MNGIDYVINNLLSPPGFRSTMFIPGDQSKICRDALVQLEQRGFWVVWVSLARVASAAQLLESISDAVCAPAPITNWGVLEDWFGRMNWRDKQHTGYFVYYKDSLNFWRTEIGTVATLINVCEPISFQWANRGTRFVQLFELL